MKLKRGSCCRRGGAMCSVRDLENTWLLSYPQMHRLTELIPEAEPWASVLRVIDVPWSQDDSRRLELHADTHRQNLLCYTTDQT